jgi:hypothetical protein
MLKKLPAPFADPQPQPNALSIGVFGFTAGAGGIVGLKCFNGSLRERESFGHSGAPLSEICMHRLGYSLACGRRIRCLLALWQVNGKVRSYSGPEMKI